MKIELLEGKTMKTSTPCWAMTAAEFCSFCHAKTSNMFSIDYGITDDEVSANLAWWKECSRLRGEFTPEHIFKDPWGHKRIVTAAIREGKHIPENVLADYPGLHQKVKPLNPMGKN